MAYLIEWIVLILVDFIWFKVFNFIGALIQWIFGTGWRLLRGKPRLKLSDYNQKPDKEAGFVSMIYESKNSMIGLLFVAVFIFAAIFIK